MTMTMAELEQYPVQHKVLVDGTEWERVEGGLARDGTTLALNHFEGYALTKQISPVANWQIHRWYRCGRHLRFLTHRVDQRIHALGFSGDAAGFTHAAWSETELPGAWHLVAPNDEDHWMKRLAGVYVETAAQIPSNVVSTLHGYADEHRGQAFEDLLDDLGVGRQREHVSQVMVTGHAFWTPTAEQATQWLDHGCVVDEVEDSATIYFRKQFQVTSTGVGCTCESIDRARVMEDLPEKVEDFEFEVECG